MFRHVVMFKWKQDATNEQRAAAVAGLRSLPGHVPQVRSFVLGEDVKITEGTFDAVIVVDFDSADDYLLYRDHPHHRALVRDVTSPIIESRSVVQHELTLQDL